MPRIDDLDRSLPRLLADFLPRQPWFPDNSAPARTTIASMDEMRKDPLLLRILAEVTLADGETATYQLVVAARPASPPPPFLEGQQRPVLGSIGDWLFYDALVDPELALDVLRAVAPDETAKEARPLTVEQTDSSVVYDERLILKLFRRLHPQPHPDVEVSRALAEQDFPFVVPQRAELRRYGFDLAVVRDYMQPSTTAWQLAQQSLSDLLDRRLPPDEAVSGFGSYAAMLGEITAKLHAALAAAMGTFPARLAAWQADMRAQLERSATAYTGSLDVAQISAAIGERLAVDDPGQAIRVHGNLHLGQFLMADSRWFVLDFGGEPRRPLAERVRPSSPLRDVAGMVRSFHYAGRAALLDRRVDVGPELDDLAAEWESRAVDAYEHGYRRKRVADRWLPDGEASQRSLVAAFELDKAIYELAYELAYRPSWKDIPLSAIERILGGSR